MNKFRIQDLEVEITDKEIVLTQHPIVARCIFDSKSKLLVPQIVKGFEIQPPYIAIDIYLVVRGIEAMYFTRYEEELELEIFADEWASEMIEVGTGFTPEEIRFTRDLSGIFIQSEGQVYLVDSEEFHDLDECTYWKGTSREFSIKDAYLFSSLEEAKTRLSSEAPIDE